MLTTLFSNPDIVFGLGIFIGLIFGLGISIAHKKYTNQKDKPELKSKPVKNIDLNEAEKAKQFLDKVIKDKFEYYLITEILPIYKVGKTLDKKQVNELKEQFFIDVSYFINKDIKNILKKYFNTEAIKIYIIEKFYILLNKVDISYFEDTKINEKDFKTMLKD